MLLLAVLLMLRVAVPVLGGCNPTATATQTQISTVTHTQVSIVKETQILAVTET
jgi:hypothetical protein